MTDPAELMAQIARLAPTKRHRLAPAMVNGTRPLSAEQAEMVLTHLRKCENMPGVAALHTPEVRATVVTRQYPQEEPQEVPRQERNPQARPQASSQLPGIRAFKGLVPAGFYATPSATGSNDLDFWKVRLGKKGGQWEGVPFPVRVLGGGSGGELRTVDLENIQQRRALQAIVEAGIEPAKLLFAKHIGRCSECGLVLTDEVSRSFGKGPTCRAKSG